jgi:hypothetical protein
MGINMYFPVLRAKRFELNALRDLGPTLAEGSKVIPIIEPVKPGGLPDALMRLVNAGCKFAFITNPKVGEFAEKTNVIELKYVDEYLDEYDNYYPALYIDSNSTTRQVGSFAARYEIPVLFFIIGEPSAQALQSIISAQPDFVAIRDGRIPAAMTGLISQSGIPLITITDRFHRKVRNSEYPDNEFFSDAYLHEGHFGDYSIVGDSYTDGGGAAFNVALHHITVQASNGLYIAHYKSDYSEDTTDVAGKFMEALTRLVEAQANCIPLNETMALRKYRDLHREEHFPGLGFAKKLGLMQHLEVVAKVLA